MVNNGSLTRSQHDRSKELHYCRIFLQPKHHSVLIPTDGILKVQATMSVIFITLHFNFEDSLNAGRPFVR